VTRPPLRVATCTTLPEPDPDEAPLAAALAAAGIDARLVAWDDPAADWTSPIPTILRSTWNYSLARDQFLAWCDAVALTAPLINPPAVVHATSHKRYLLELAARDVPIVPTVLIPAGGALGDTAASWDRIVIKPAVAAGSLGAKVFARDERDAAAAHVAAWTARGEVLVQPYLASVETHGERSLIWIDGAFTHAIRKSPRFSGDAEQVTGPHPIAVDEQRVAEAALEPWAATEILYGRVDLARDALGNPCVMELELIEPSLFFAKHPPSVDRYIAGLTRRLRAAGAWP
jgi:glutathione synthase/RimK-type ligase-like ATP-grasp enzyme